VALILDVIDSEDRVAQKDFTELAAIRRAVDTAHTCCHIAIN